MSPPETTAEPASSPPAPSRGGASLASSPASSSRGPSSRDLDGPRRWLVPGAGAAALLLLPMLAWLLLPVAHPVAPTAHATAAPLAAAPRAGDAPSRPRGDAPRVVRPAAAPAPQGSADAPRAPITGTVVGPNDAPVSEATVGCDDGRDVDRVDTDGDGHFRLAPEAEGCRAVARSARFGRSVPVVLAAGSDNVLHLGSSSGIEGVVVDESGAPLSPYFLYVDSFTPASDRKELDHQRYIDDPKGAFQWSGLPPGHYVLLAAADGRAPTRSAPIDVVDGAVVKDVKIVVASGAKLDGIVVDAQTKSPIASATIALYMTGPYGLVLRPPVTTGPDGSFAMTGLPAGAFPLRVTGKGYENKLFSDVTAGGGRQTFAITREASN